MLLVFSLSITPKIFLHQLVANHKDRSYTAHSHTDQFTKAGFRCNCENQVVEVPYLNYSTGVDLVVYSSFQIDRTTPIYQFPSFPYFIFGLRGPPSHV